MFGLGGLELGLIFLVLFLVMRPEDLPVFFNKLGRWYHKGLRIYYSFIDEINKEASK